MKKNNPVKAYKNIEFLISPQARTVRILSEFLEPLSRFQREGIQDTIVIFGSARILPRKNAKKRLEDIQKLLFKTRYKSKKLKQKLEEAKIDFEISRYYDDALRLSSLLTKWSRSLDKDSHLVICSGGGPGIMEAANKGAIKAGGKSIGLNISLPHEQGQNPYISKNLGFEFHYFFMRKLWFVDLAKAMIMFPGGFGTMDELWEVLTLIQTKKVIKPLPIILYGSDYWKQVINFPAMVKHHTISINDLKL
ncbi:MAG: LOG family protein [Ignavibacteriales bacterium]|nr:LOG family protein [Ignavibacteriales bacterium]